MAAAAASHKPSGCRLCYLHGLKLQEASAQCSGLPTKVQHASSEGGVKSNAQVPVLGWPAVDGLRWAAGQQMARASGGTGCLKGWM